MPTDSLISGLQNLPHFYFAAGASLRMTINMDADFSLTGKVCEVSIAPKEKKPIRAFTLTSADSDIAISGQTVTIEIEPTKETAPAFTGGWTLADVQAAGETEIAVSFYASGQPVDLRLQGNVTWVTKGGEFDYGEAVVAAPNIDVAVSSGVVSVTVSSASPTLTTDTPVSGLSGILKSASNTLAVAVAGTDYVAPGSDAADLGSGTATDGWVLTADGAGGAAWEAAAGGSVTLDTNTATSGLTGILKAASNSLDVAVAGTHFRRRQGAIFHRLRNRRAFRSNELCADVVGRCESGGDASHPRTRIVQLADVCGAYAFGGDVDGKRAVHVFADLEQCGSHV